MGVGGGVFLGGVLWGGGGGLVSAKEKRERGAAFLFAIFLLFIWSGLRGDIREFLK